MLTACQSSPATSPKGPSADPIVRVDRRVETRCPAELEQAVPARIAKAPGAELTGNDAGLAWLRAHLGRENLLEGRLVDAAKACPKVGAGGSGGPLKQ